MFTMCVQYPLNPEEGGTGPMEEQKVFLATKSSL